MNETQVTSKQERAIFSKRVAIQLREAGYDIVRTAVNHKRPEFQVYFFEQTDELNEKLNQLIQMNKEFDAKKKAEKEETVVEAE